MLGKARVGLVHGDYAAIMPIAPAGEAFVEEAGHPDLRRSDEAGQAGQHKIVQRAHGVRAAPVDDRALHVGDFFAFDVVIGADEIQAALLGHPAVDESAIGERFRGRVRLRIGEQEGFGDMRVAAGGEAVGVELWDEQEGGALAQAHGFRCGGDEPAQCPINNPGAVRLIPVLIAIEQDHRTPCHRCFGVRIFELHHGERPALRAFPDGMYGDARQVGLLSKV